MLVCMTCLAYNLNTDIAIGVFGLYINNRLFYDKT